jgi:long-chain acyl-CoA synthetase
MGNTQVICGKFVGPEIAGQTRILRNAALEDSAELCGDFKGMVTIPELFKHAHDNFPNNNLFGTRRKDAEGKFQEYQWTNCKTAYERSHNMAKSLHKLEVCPKTHFDEGDFKFMGLYAKNREEWCQSDLACAMSGITVVTLYDTLGKASIEFIVSQTSMASLILSADKIKLVASMRKEGMLKSLKNLIYFDEASAEDQASAAEQGLTLHSYQALIDNGSKLSDNEAPYAAVPVTGDTFYTFSYTSGTTGVPKGVMLSHRNFVCNIGGMARFDGGQFSLLDDDVYISYLPLAHVFERFMYLCMIPHGIGIGFY